MGGKEEICIRKQHIGKRRTKSKTSAVALKTGFAAVVATGGMAGLAETAVAGTLPASDAPPVVNGWVQVSTPAQLEYIDTNPTAAIQAGSSTTYLSANIHLTKDISLSGYMGWIPFGGNSMPTDYSGTFDGQGHVVTNINLNDSSDGNVGLFGVVSGTVKNLGVSGSVTAGANAYAGLLVGDQNGGYLTDDYASGSVTGGDNSSVGGLAGYFSDGIPQVSESYTDVKVSGGLNSNDGGIVGYQYAGHVSDVYAVGSVAGGGSPSNVGGIAGLMEGSSSVSTITGAYYDLATSNTTGGIGSGLGSATGESDTNMKLAGTFSGWDFTNLWGISASVNHGYPYLQAFHPLAVSTPALPSDGEGQTYPVTSLSATGGTGGGYIWTATGLPSGLSLTKRGTITGTPKQSGTFTVGLTVQDNGGHTASSSMKLSVVGVPTGLTTSNVTSSGWTETWNAVPGATSYDVFLDKSSSPTATVQVPRGSTATTFSYTFTNQSPNTTHSVVVTAAAGNAVSVASSADTITTLPALTIGTTQLSSVLQGTAYSQTLAAEGGKGPYSFAIDGGSLPAGLTLGSDGKLSGSPSAPGSYSLTVKVTDAAGDTATKDYQLYVIPTAPAGFFGTIEASQDVDASGGTLMGYNSKTHATLVILAGTFVNPLQVNLTSGSVPASLLTSGSLISAFGVNFASSVTPAHSLTLTLLNSSITPTSKVYKIADGKLIPVKATVASGKAVISFTTDPAFVVLQPKPVAVPNATQPVTGFPARDWGAGGMVSILLGGLILWRNRRRANRD